MAQSQVGQLAMIDDIRHELHTAVEGVGGHTFVITAGPGSGKTYALRRLVDGLGPVTRWVTVEDRCSYRPYDVAGRLLDVPLGVATTTTFTSVLDAALDALRAQEVRLAVIDDAHNADEGSLKLLAEIASASTTLSLTIVLTRRHLPARSPLNQLLSCESVREWQLPWMNSADLAELTANIVGAPPEPRLAALLASSGGHPTHARALLEDLQARGELTIADDLARIAPRAERFASVDGASTTPASPSTVAPMVGALELDLATTLTHSGQLARAAQIATRALTNFTDPVTVARLYRLLVFAHLLKGNVCEVRELVASARQLPLDTRTRTTLRDVTHVIGLLSGTDRADAGPYPAQDPPTAAELITEGLRMFLSGEGTCGLALVVEAVRRQRDAGDGDELDVVAHIWLPFIEQFVHGPIAAANLLEQTAPQRAEHSLPWIAVYNDLVFGNITAAQGRLSEAATAIDTGLARAAAAGIGWTAFGEGTRAAIDVYRGDVVGALARIDRFAETTPTTLSIPTLAHARILMLEAQRRLRPAAAMAITSWSDAVDLGLKGWLPSLAVDFARVALRADDSSLVEAIATAIGGASGPPPPAQVGPMTLAAALCTREPDQVRSTAVECAHRAHDLGDRIAEVCAFEEAACAAAVVGDKAAAREYACSALAITQNMGALGLANRITSRLRRGGLRLDPRTARQRARSGWESLTPAETTIAALIAAGLNGNEIAQNLYVSHRTVQTHVSHILTKLGLRTRVDIAIAVTRRNAS